jgi:hypothetical protein
LFHLSFECGFLLHSGTAQSIQPPRALDSALARRTTQASLALAVRPPETVRPFTQPFAATRANGASLLSPTVRSASAAGLHTTTLGQSAAATARFGKMATGSRARVSDADTVGELDIQVRLPVPTFSRTIIDFKHA